MQNQVYIGVDFGKKRIGLARSDASGLIASAYKTITYKSIKKAVEEIVTDIAESGAVGVVVGYPLAPDGGQMGESCQNVDEFIDRLKKLYNGPIYKVDESDTSVEAGAIIHRHKKKTGQDKARIDRIAAALILQRFLDEGKNRSGK